LPLRSLPVCHLAQARAGFVNFAIAGVSAFRLFNILTSHPVFLYQVGVAVAVKFFVTDFLRGGTFLNIVPHDGLLVNASNVRMVIALRPAGSDVVFLPICNFDGAVGRALSSWWLVVSLFGRCPTSASVAMPADKRKELYAKGEKLKEDVTGKDQ
jgi:hypothetical protein